MRISQLVRRLFRSRLTEKTPDVMPLIQPSDVVSFGSCGDKSSNVRTQSPEHGIHHSSGTCPRTRRRTWPVKSLPLFGPILVAVLIHPASANVTLSRSDDAVVLENSLVRVELPRDRNFQPSVLVDRRNPQQSLIDDVGFLAWDVLRGDWMISSKCDWTLRVKTYADDKSVWCETTLSRELPDATLSRLTLRSTVRERSPAIKFDFHAKFQPEHVHTLGLRIQASNYNLAEWTTSWGTSNLKLTGRRNSFHTLHGFRNGMALTRRIEGSRSGLLLFHNTAWDTVFPTLREKPALVRYKHPTSVSPARCSITLVPFSGDAALSANTKKWGRPGGVALPDTRPRSTTTRRQKTYVVTPVDKERGLVAFPVVPFAQLLPDSLPSAKSVGGKMHIRVCAGEYEPASFAIRALKPFRRVTFSVSDLVFDDNIIPAAAIDAHVVKVWRQAGPPTIADTTLGAGQLIPELLLRDDRVELTGSRPQVRLTGPVETEMDPDSTKQFWLTVRVPDKIPAGHYRGNVAITARDTAAVVIPLEVEVLPFSLSPTRKKQGIWFKAERRPDQLAYVEPDVYRRLLEDVRAHGMQFVTIRGRGMRIAEDVLKIHQAAGMSGTTIWSSWFPSSVSDFGPLRRNLETATRTHGYERLYFQAADEPNDEERITRAMTYFTKVKSAGGRTFCNISPEYAVRLGQQLDIPCVGYSSFFGSLERPEPVRRQTAEALTRLLKSHDDVWYYWQCRVEDPRINRLLFGFLLMKSPATGAMPYTYSTLDTEQPFDDWSALQQGQVSRAGGGAVYHSRAGSLPTIQWEAAREGVDDARYVSTLENLIRDARPDPDFTTAVDRAEQTLKSVYAQLPSHLCDTIQNVSPGDLDAMRSKIIDAILMLQGVVGN